ncbi:hypothetical protein OJF2_45460 [Aquisphaera giovannonii]|uniref:Four-helix bundle copper-binding protein n=1 Tax=Aquisphaera giovannonii TaxID=406548 RepID=A0A5B9W630_9BACT|nr:hypothetical protein [Aquisphaera giovannonii]QEH35988.1 hypothetical protein OJF2_45460 [Aquisphaera giovannonii]
MRRREMLGALGASPLAAAAATAGQGAAAGDDGPPAGRGVGAGKDPRTGCVEQCERLAKLCLAVSYTLLDDLKAGRGDRDALIRLHRALVDVREFATLAATMVLRDSPFRAPACSSCAYVCDRAAAIAGGAAFEAKGQVVEALEECATSCRDVTHMKQARP